ncbi:unnamed protein product [Acanthosepion pharaonis]|uniref:Uncharacterized protein n=1 Tax=Acanthosepion pharaonis TaxID=158019 RepID=A0A812CDZ6_ACAPH|nr:unnamed protein product [Sepia pharaonis]
MLMTTTDPYESTLICLPDFFLLSLSFSLFSLTFSFPQSQISFTQVAFFLKKKNLFFFLAAIYSSFTDLILVLFKILLSSISVTRCFKKPTLLFFFLAANYSSFIDLILIVFEILLSPCFFFQPHFFSCFFFFFFTLFSFRWLSLSFSLRSPLLKFLFFF